jgi:membrane protease YdiL (CAAX protease family)
MDWPAVLVIAVMVALCAAAWTAVVNRRRAGLPVVSLTPRRPAPWRIVDLLIIAIFYVLATFALQAVLSLIASAANWTNSGGVRPARADQAASPTELAIALAASIAANLATAGFAILWIFSHTDATLEDFGWRRDKVREDLRLGLIAFAAIATPIYGLQALLSQFVKEQHPIIEVLLRQPIPLLYVLAGLSAVAVAPLAEEFFFRVLLQGWLESAVLPADNPMDEHVTTSEHRPRPLTIVVTSLVFASLHIGHGAAPVPLFFLALALGYLYQRTHRLLPSVTVHFCLNACSFAMLCLAPPEAG